MIFVKTPLIVTRVFFPNMIWHLTRHLRDKSIHLTFDDGPTPDVTHWVLDKLKEYKATATFFCLGRNVEKYPEIYNRIVGEGHSVGNHTYSHLRGLMVNGHEYVNDVRLAGNYITSDLFRPPYGRIRPGLVNWLKKDYRIMMWDVLSYDFSSKVTPLQCYSNVVNNVSSGSIVVFHDSQKARRNLEYALPGVLDAFSGSHEFRKII
jgi:peptidoglycan/xylan/chitin deacetylase (PgdA/CDA1 family)